MSGEQRENLREGQEIQLFTSADLVEARSYRIAGIAGEGGSAVCYDAVRLSDGMTGKLKEFNPTNFAGEGGARLERLPDGTLASAEEGAVQSFQEACERYAEKYRKLNRAIEKNETLKNFIQEGDILYSGSREGGALRRGSVYIWTRGLSGRSFDKYLKEIHREPKLDANRKLRDILRILISLSDAVRALHCAGIVHMDIKPSNFLIPDNSVRDVNTGVVSMYDINSFYNALYDDSASRIGTPGYCAPEVVDGSGNVDGRSDIFSIGATLLYAIAARGDGWYRCEDFDKISGEVRQSPLIQALRLKSEAREALIDRLTGILQRCLSANQNGRYPKCDDLIDALQAAAKLAEPDGSETASRGAAKELMRSMLYVHPLYESIPAPQRDIRVLVLGSDVYAMEFIDVCLEAAQMKDYALRIDAYSERPNADCEAYLKERPAMKRFVSVEDAQGCIAESIRADDPRAYGTLRFLPYPETVDEKGAPILRFGGDLNRNKFLAENILCGAIGNEDVKYLYDYVFVSLDDPGLNPGVAASLAVSNSMEEDAQGARPPICYVSESANPEAESANDGVYALRVNRPFSPMDVNPELEQMAFNAHLIWQSANIDVNRELEKFRANAYEYNSSMAFALSVKYKLHSIGIALEGDMKLADQAGFTVVKDAAGAAKEFYEQVLLPRSYEGSDEKLKRARPEAEAKFNALVALEHRRWVLNLVADGWDAPWKTVGEKKILDFRKCFDDRKVRNNESKTHPCLVFSTEATPLSSIEYRKNNREKWDNTSIDEKLDELDHMSVALHQYWRKRAKDQRTKNDPLQSTSMEGLDRYIRRAEQSEDSEGMRTYLQFRFCIRNILNGVESYSRHYDRYAKAVEKLLEEIRGADGDLEEYKKAQENLTNIGREIFPAREANLYRDYKANDEILIDRLPYILTYRFRPCIALAFEDGLLQNGRNEAVFADVASATVLSPERIVYLYHCDRDSNPQLFARKVSAVLNYLDKREVHTRVSFAIACTNAAAPLKDELRKLNRTACQGRSASFDVSDCKFFKCGDEDAAIDQLSAYLDENEIDLYDGSTQLFRSASSSASFVRRVTEKLPYFEFDWRRKRFIHLTGCEYLRYIQDTTSFIRVNDMFALMNAKDIRFNVPMFMENYRALWTICTENIKKKSDQNFDSFQYSVGNWNMMCKKLEEYEAACEREGKRTLAVFELEYNSSAREERSYYSLSVDEHTIDYLCKRLKDFGVLDEYKIERDENGGLKLRVTARSAYIPSFDQLAKYLGSGSPKESIQVIKRTMSKGAEVIVSRDTLCVEKASLGLKGDNAYRYSFPILKMLEEKHFISDLEEVPEKEAGTKNGLVSFRYASAHMKKLLTTAGEILEIYTYYKVLETGYFDDVVCGYEFAWEDGEVKNELDLVLTKGFRSIIIECKAVAQLNLNYYHKLDSICEKFGIGALKVLVGNTYNSQDQGFAAANDLQRSRGNQLSIVTLNGKDTIQNIGAALQQLMEEANR